MIKSLQTRGFFAVHNVLDIEKGVLMCGIIFVGEKCSQDAPLSIINIESGQTFKIKPLPQGVYKNQELELWHT